MVSRRTIAAVIACALMALPGAAGAGDAGTDFDCGKVPTAERPNRTWKNGGESCHFWFGGFPMIVFGDATANGSADVSVRITLDEEGEIPILSCSDAAQGFAQCSSGIPDETTPLPTYGGAKYLLLYCHVEGFKEGGYKCLSSI